MGKTRTIPVYHQIDVQTARMYTREAARLIGLPLIEQARVSLATSTLAECMKVGTPDGSDQGRLIIIESIEDEAQAASRKGLRIEFYIPSFNQNDSLQEQIGKIRPLVDEVLIETLPDNGIRVILWKWELPGPFEHENRPDMRKTGTLSGGQ